MEQTKDILNLNELGLNELKFPRNERKKVARRRWAILAKALKSPTGSEPSSPTDEYSVRRISSFMLLKTNQLPVPPISSNDSCTNKQILQRTWYKYFLNAAPNEYHINVGHRNRTFSAEDLMGFNNTGNVCIWPSEETLTYYVCNNLHLFAGKRVLELGGGMSCLAGLFVAKYGKAKSVLVTDGNRTSIRNVSITLKCNDFKSPVAAQVLKWNSMQLNQVYDVILCADCLFFDEARTDLIECIWGSLTQDGLALVMAPQRGTTLTQFIQQCDSRGFQCQKICNYNQVVWEKREKLLDNLEYNDNIHYPVLIKVMKRSQAL